MKIQQSAEDYLETMLILEEKYGYIRSIDIAKHLGVTKPSVSYAVTGRMDFCNAGHNSPVIVNNQLKPENPDRAYYINMEANGPITLAPPGRRIATRIYERHKALRSFLELLGVDPETAEEDACKIEHVISHDTYVAICKHVNQYSDIKIDSFEDE